MKSKILVIVLLIINNISLAQTTLVENITEFNIAIKKAVPGTTIVLKNGEWKDVHLKVTGIGKKESPITIKAETQGKVIITGDSKMNIYGKYLVVDGLWFKNGNPTSKSVISFRKDSKEFAYNSRVTNCVISYFNPDDISLNTHWIDLWGKNNRVDHNNFTGKTNDGTTLVVWLKGEAHIENNHQIDHNHFGFRPDLGKNGGETIRIGTSANSMKSSKTIVENNTFKNCDGEIEIISNKSGDNIYRNNLFLGSKGTLTLRHGNNAIVESNVFLGQNISNTGGIRIINEGHIVRNNLLVGLKGEGFRGPIVIMNGVPNSPLNRYNQVKNVDIQNNTIINCPPIEFGAGKDSERSLAPTQTLFANNLITNTNSGNIFVSHDNISGITFKNNIVDSEAEVDLKYFNKLKIDWKLLRSLPVPSDQNSDLISTFKNDKSPNEDISGTNRNKNAVGAFNLNNLKYPKALLVKSGPNWKPKIIPPVVVPKKEVIEVAPGVETLSKALKKANSGATIKLTSGTYLMSKTQKIKGKITIIGNNQSIIKASENLEKPLNYFFRVEQTSTLTLDGLVLDGESTTPVKYAIVSPDKNNADSYNLYIRNSTFQNFTNEKGGAIFKAYVGTMADTISIVNSKFKDSYRGLNLSYEKTFGRYNAQVVNVHNSVFSNISEFAISYAKVDPTLSLVGGRLIISNSVFNRVGNYEKGSVVKTKGLNNVKIKNSVFINSYNIKYPINLKGTGTSIENCLIHSSGAIKVSNGAVQKNIFYKSPKWDDKKHFIPGKKSYLLKENNNTERIGLLENN